MVHLFGMSGLTGRDQAKTLLLPRSALELWQLPKLPAVIRLAGGKPVFREQPELHFNLSHSGSLALCALSEEPVGVDIEQIRPRRPGLAEYVLSPEEQLWYRDHGTDDAALLLLWTRKEAWCKRSGKGLTFPVREITPPLPGTSDELRSYRGDGGVASVCGCAPLPAEITWLAPTEQ